MPVPVMLLLADLDGIYLLVANGEQALDTGPRPKIFISDSLEDMAFADRFETAPIEALRPFP
jgi:hypothetical protein